MKLENRFTVPVPRAEALNVLLDVERITPCLPGATLTSHDGDAFTGTVKVKVGPINLTYSGRARFASVDEQAGTVVIEASGKETRGTGTAKATVTCRLIDKGDATDIEVDTDLNITGKPAQFGRGVLADVSSKLVDQFASCLAEEILAGTPGTASAGSEPASVSGPASEQPAPPPRVVREAEPINLLDAAGSPVLKRLAPLVAALAVLLLVVRRLRR
jgi:carbon monoxide dehydrogenase subunit G